MIHHRTRSLVRALSVAAIFLAQWAFGMSSQGTGPHGMAGRVLHVLGPNRLVVEGPDGVRYQILMRGTARGTTGHAATRDAENRLVEMLVGRHVSVSDIAGGTSSTLLGVVRFRHEDINYQWLRDALLVFDGITADAAMVDACTAAEDEARAAGLGVWAGDVATAAPLLPAVPANPPPADGSSGRTGIHRDADRT